MEEKQEIKSGDVRDEIQDVGFWAAVAVVRGSVTQQALNFVSAGSTVQDAGGDIEIDVEDAIEVPIESDLLDSVGEHLWKG